MPKRKLIDGIMMRKEKTLWLSREYIDSNLKTPKSDWTKKCLRIKQLN